VSVDIVIPVIQPFSREYDAGRTDRAFDEVLLALALVRESLTSLPVLLTGNGDPETNITANVGALYLRKDGGTGTTLYVKETGTDATGWVAK